jgi:hypothetical protein
LVHSLRSGLACGQPAAEKGFIPHAIPVCGLATVVARTDGSFLIIH